MQIRAFFYNRVNSRFVKAEYTNKRTGGKGEEKAEFSLGREGKREREKATLKKKIKNPRPGEIGRKA